MEEVYKKAMEDYANVPDMYNYNLTQARDATTNAIKEAQQNLVGRLGAGGASPAMFSQIGQMGARAANEAAAKSAGEVFDRKMQALGVAGGQGTGLAADLRAQQGLGIDAYKASIDAYRAQQEAETAWQKMYMDAQIAKINAMMGIYGKYMDIYGNAMSGIYGGLGNAYGQALGSALG
jgi:hypothetical protein